MKKAKDINSACKIQEDFKDSASGFIQWKGTDVCMDVFCKCGNTSHIDADFAYQIKCGHCGTVYACNPNIELIELETYPNDVLTTDIY